MSVTETEQFRNGKTVEAFLDRFAARRGWKVRTLTAHEERRLCLGDREFTMGPERFFVEYKSGIQSHYTQNIFFETVSVDSANKPGWVYTSRADFIIYACLLDRELLIFQPESLRSKIEALKVRYPTVPTSAGQNKDYRTWGVIVPMRVAKAEIPCQILQLSQEDLNA